MAYGSFSLLSVVTDETPTQETEELARVQEATTKTLHTADRLGVG
jgi:hypothetical protein